MTAGRIDLEREWHDRYFAARPKARPLDPRVVQRYLHQHRRPLFYKEMMFDLAPPICVWRRKVLVVGCGDDNMVSLLASTGTYVYAFDLSPEAIASQHAQLAANGLHAELCVAPAEEMPWADVRFDYIIGSMILHHLPDALPEVCTEILARLKPRGVAIFAEPIALSPALQRLRRAMPLHTVLSPGERQLLPADLRVLESYFKVRTHYFRLLGRLHRFTLRGPLETAGRLSRTLTLGLAWLDAAVLRIPALQRYAGTAVFEMRPHP